MKKLNSEPQKGTKGITLVALVITIIIIIILATVALSFVFGDNGLIKRAEDAKDMYTNDTEYTQESIKDAETYINDILDGNKSNNSEKVDGVLIPDGFVYVGGTKADGIVISDNKEDENKGTDHETAKNLKGNQFVWIPVESDELFKRYRGYSNNSLQSLEQFNSSSEPFEYASEIEKQEYEQMVDSVLRNDGFYVGRYEAGTTNSARVQNSGIEDEVIIRQGAYVYNWVQWSEDINIENHNGGAVEKAREFDDEKGYESVSSTLIYGVQWDAIMNFIDSKYSSGECLENSFVMNSSGKGLYDSDSPGLTGANEMYAVKNIFDLGGNVYEWTMETYMDRIRVYRGGSYANSGIEIPASYRSYDAAQTLQAPFLGFRVALFLNN